MKLHDDNDSDFNRITAFDGESVTINTEVYGASLIVLKDHVNPSWGVGSAAELKEHHIDAMLEREPQIVILGTGSSAFHEGGEWLRKLAVAGVGFEIMSTPAACRTYNILAGEGRNVAAGLIIGERAPLAGGAE